MGKALNYLSDTCSLNNSSSEKLPWIAEDLPVICPSTNTVLLSKMLATVAEVIFFSKISMWISSKNLQIFSVVSGISTMTCYQKQYRDSSTKVLKIFFQKCLRKFVSISLVESFNSVRKFSKSFHNFPGEGVLTVFWLNLNRK